MAIIRWLLISGVCLYVLFGGMLYLMQRSMLYHPTATRISPADAGLPQAQEAILTTSDGEKLVAWHVPPHGDKPVVIYFHGNAEIVPWRAERHRATIANGTGLIAPNFRGYGGSTGTPTEDGLHRDAAAAYAFAAERYPPRRIVLWGVSLGTGAAVRLAAEKPVGKLILESPYSSTVDVAAGLDTGRRGTPRARRRTLHDARGADRELARVRADEVTHRVEDRAIGAGHGCLQLFGGELQADVHQAERGPDVVIERVAQQ